MSVRIAATLFLAVIVSGLAVVLFGKLSLFVAIKSLMNMVL